MQISELCRELPDNYIPEPLLLRELSPEQWKALESINVTLQDEYSLRRQMLLRRLDVTVQSFKWSDRAKVGRELLVFGAR